MWTRLNSYMYILVTGDGYTRQIEKYPITNEQATTVTQKLMNKLFFHFLYIGETALKPREPI